jgi:DNA transposition AAA+ family ATPase
MNATEKREIQYKLRIYIADFSSQKKACQSLDDVSEATVIAMLDQKEKLWSGISDQMWRNVANQVGGVVDFNRLVETRNFNTIISYFETAREEGATFAIIGNSGFGKSYAAKWYAAVNRKNNVYYLECAEYWNKKMFCQRLMMQVGKNWQGMSTAEMMSIIIRDLRRQERPIIILDEIDKLPDPVFKFFITLYNELNKVCGFIWLSTDAIQKRMDKGVEKNVIGYKELFSRIGGTFIQLTQASTDEVSEICKANGITDTALVSMVCNEVKELKGDLRRVDRNILKNKIKTRKQSKAA